MKWIKASDLLPNEYGRITWRWLDKEAAYIGYDDKGFVYDKGGAHCGPLYHSEIEWLDESGSEHVFTIEDMQKAWQDGKFEGVRGYQFNDGQTFEMFMKEEYNIDYAKK